MVIKPRNRSKKRRLNLVTARLKLETGGDGVSTAVDKTGSVVMHRQETMARMPKIRKKVKPKNPNPRKPSALTSRGQVVHAAEIAVEIDAAGLVNRTRNRQLKKLPLQTTSISQKPDRSPMAIVFRNKNLTVNAGTAIGTIKLPGTAGFGSA